MQKHDFNSVDDDADGNDSDDTKFKIINRKAVPHFVHSIEKFVFSKTCPSNF